MTSKANEPEVKGRRGFKEHIKLTHIDRNVFTYIVSIAHGWLLFVFVKIKMVFTAMVETTTDKKTSLNKRKNISIIF